MRKSKEEPQDAGGRGGRRTVQVTPHTMHASLCKCTTAHCEENHLYMQLALSQDLMLRLVLEIEWLRLFVFSRVPAFLWTPPPAFAAGTNTHRIRISPEAMISRMELFLIFEKPDRKALFFGGRSGCTMPYLRGNILWSDGFAGNALGFTYPCRNPPKTKGPPKVLHCILTLFLLASWSSLVQACTRPRA